MRNLTLFCLFVSFTAMAAKPICVRNVGEVPCNTYPQAYAYVHPYAPTTTKVCTRIYDSFYCNSAKEYEEVKTLDGDIICVLNDNQPSVVNLCSKAPQYYDYINEE